MLIFQEIDTALEVAGLFAAGQFAVRRLLFAEDRKKTASEIKCAVFSAQLSEFDGSSCHANAGHVHALCMAGNGWMTQCFEIAL